MCHRIMLWCAFWQTQIVFAKYITALLQSLQSMWSDGDDPLTSINPGFSDSTHIHHNNTTKSSDVLLFDLSIQSQQSPIRYLVPTYKTEKFCGNAYLYISISDLLFKNCAFVRNANNKKNNLRSNSNYMGRTYDSKY